MNKTRIEAYTDAIVAIVMTIMALEIKVPDGTSLNNLLTETPYFVAFVISFLSIANAWYHHHYIFTKAAWISKGAFGANNLWLLTMAFFPVATGWVSEHMNSRVPEYFYFFVYVIWAASFYLLNYIVVRSNSAGMSKMNASLSRVSHWKIDLVLLIIGFICIYFVPFVGLLIAVAQNITWLILTPPDSDKTTTHP